MSTGEAFTGMFTFPDPDHPRDKQFGMAGCAGLRPGEAVLTVIFRLHDTGIVCSVDGSSVRLDIPERLAHAALPVIAKALERWTTQS